MDKESRQLLQEIDCNCNDCGFFVRDFDALNASKAQWRKNDARSIHSVRRHYWDEAQKALEKGRTESYQALLKERSRVTVDKSYKAGLVFGRCSKLDKDVRVVPGVCQPSTQDCFLHRKRM